MSCAGTMMDWSKGEGFVPYPPGKRGSNQSPIHASASRDESWLLSDSILGMGLHTSSSGALQDAALPLISSNKAVFTVLLPSSKILIVNSVACKLLDYTSDELCSLSFDDLLHNRSNLVFNTWADSTTDDVVFHNGKVVELTNREGLVVAVSLFLKKIDPPQRCLAIAVPINRRSAQLTIDTSGRVISSDEECSALFLYDNTELTGLDIRSLVPGLVLRELQHLHKDKHKLQLTGRNKDGSSFPMSVEVSRAGSNLEWWLVVVRVYSNLSGVLVLNKDLTVANCNHHFTKQFFGFPKQAVLGESIARFLPNFCEETDCMRERCGTLYQSDDSASSSEGEETEDDRGVVIQENLDEVVLGPQCDVGLRNSKSDELFSKSETGLAEGLHATTSNKELQRAVVQEAPPKLVKNRKYCASSELRPSARVCDGRYSGCGRHQDGTTLDLQYRVKTAIVEGRPMLRVWVSWGVAEQGGVPPGPGPLLTLTSSFNSTSLEDSTTRDSDRIVRPGSDSIISQCDEVLTAGEYSEHYTNLQQIGKGAFGYVKMAYRNVDGFLVITKFIKKQKINVKSWVLDPHLNMKVPLEISLLTTLQHPNIVQVLDVFHNEAFFQLIMEKHGAGLDLFEFIDRKPVVDEQLNSYIFRQMVSAVHYLDSLGILHRDIKDENIIINEAFQVKLIDFGSATFMSPDRLFSTFYGTVEYCSPEVLQGNKYKGPELEIWALGVTLYVLTFGENPFYDVEETISGKYSIPAAVSSELQSLLQCMLEKDVTVRTSIQRVMSDPWVNQPVQLDKYRFAEVLRCYHDEAYPARYISEYCVAADDDAGDVDDDRTVASSNSFCSLHTIENVDCDDPYQECLQESSSHLMSSTPVKRDRIIKSLSVVQGCSDHHNNSSSSNNNKRFSLDLDKLKHLEEDGEGQLEREIMEELEKLRILENSNNNELQHEPAFQILDFMEPQDPLGALEPLELDCFWDAEDDKFDEDSP